MNKIELLAPAKNYEFGVAAINSGADALYIGAPSFGARKAASNSISDISKLINYAHLFNVPVYVTVNTLIYENELSKVELLIKQLYDIGSDAIIFQDFAILNMDLPPIKLFASTQTNNFDIERIKFLDKLNVDRIILARELNLNQIKEIRKHTSVELESFIFGALCVSFSGQCYLSRALGDRSANRGECAQPCRNIYSLTDKNGNIIIKDKHLLSIKDLNLEDFIPLLIDAGVTSFKIEGRLKDIDYVINVVSYFRNKIDTILIDKNLAKSSSGIIKYNFVPNLSKTFNRNFTNYFITSKKNKIAFHNSPKFIGEKLGQVIKSSNGIIEIKTQEELNNGDGLCFFIDNKLYGIRLNKYEDGKVFINKPIIIKPGTIIYRNYDKKFIDLLLNNAPIRKIRASILIESTLKGIKFVIKDEDDNTFCHFDNTQHEKAINSAKQLEILKNRITKTGNTYFIITKVEINLSIIPYIKISELNFIKDLLINGLQKTRIENYKRISTTYQKAKINYFEKELDYKSNVINPLAKKFYMDRGVKNIELGFDSNTNIKNVDLMTTKYCLRYEINQCFLNPKTTYRDELFLISNGNKFKLEFDCENCVMKIKKA
jgi:putative protease